jgi:hypothetical protein
MSIVHRSRAFVHGGWALSVARGIWRRLRPAEPIFMPFKFNAARRHGIPRAQYRVRNWREYDAGLRRRGDLTLWLDETAVDQWQAPRRTMPGGQARYCPPHGPARPTPPRASPVPGSFCARTGLPRLIVARSLPVGVNSLAISDEASLIKASSAFYLLT